MFAVKYLQIRFHGNRGLKVTLTILFFSDVFLCLRAQGFLEAGQVVSHIPSPGLQLSTLPPILEANSLTPHIPKANVSSS